MRKGAPPADKATLFAAHDGDDLVADVPKPVPAIRHASYGGTRGGATAAMLTTYLVLLFAVPSNLQWTILGSLGKPATLWGLVLLAWWLLSQLHPRTRGERSVHSPTRVLFVLFCVVVLVSYAAALLRGQPADQIGSTTTSLVRIASWAGVLFVAADGIQTRDELVTVFRRLTIAAAALAALGFAQLLTGATLLEWVGSIPGWSVEWGGTMDTKGGLLRATGTSTHPLEFSSSMTALLPITIAYAAIAPTADPRHPRRWLVPPAALLVLLLLTVSRSAIIGLAIAVLVLVPFLPRAFRMVFLTVGALGALTVTVLFPRVVLTTLASFTGVAEDPSTLSRTTALARVPEFAAASPLFGAGWGAFLPRYYIFDNAWVLMLIEAGIIGVTLFAMMMLAGTWRALRTAATARNAEHRALAGALAASLATMTVLLALFDGMSFAIFAGTLFLMLGLATAVREIARDAGSGSTRTRSRSAGSGLRGSEELGNLRPKAARRSHLEPNRGSASAYGEEHDA